MARKKIKLENSVGASVPLSSMIDVVFLLLIYFIFTQKEVVEDVYLQLNLPAPQSSSSNEDPPPMLRIDVGKNDRDDFDKDIVFYAVNADATAGAAGQAMEFQQLRSYLQIVADNSKDTTIVLNCGSYAEHKKLIKVLDLCNSLGLANLNLLNEVSDFDYATERAKRKKK